MVPLRLGGPEIRLSTKQGNKRIAEQMEAAHRTSLAKGEVGLRTAKKSPVLREFAEASSSPISVPTLGRSCHDPIHEAGVKMLIASSRCRTFA